MKNVYVYLRAYKDFNNDIRKGSMRMKEQLYKIVKERINSKNFNVKLLYINEKKIYDKNSIYIFVKYISDIKYILELKKNNNIIIYEPLDYYWSKYDNINKYIENLKYIYNTYFNYVLVNNKKLCILFNQKNIFCNYHEYDINYHVNKNKISNEIIYLGDILKSSFTEKSLEKNNIIHIKSYENKNLKKKVYNPNIHIDYCKNNHKYYNLHTSTKLGTCLFFNSIFICNKVPIYIELLGEDYKYYLNEDFSNFKELNLKAIKTLENIDNYNLYLKSVEHVKKKLHPNNISDDIIHFLNNIYT
tara:strand:+ start:2005 stop:2910 length:906 start_codon:yes stop_codon:yes gene_type:complete